MDADKLETESATTEREYHVRVQIPPDGVSTVLKAIEKATPLQYGNYGQVAFRYNTGSLQFKPLTGSAPGDTSLLTVPCDEISFTLPKNDETITAVNEAIFQSHPYEEPVILIQEGWSTRFKHEQAKTNPNKWWNRPDVDWD